MNWYTDPPPHRQQVLVAYKPTSKSAKGQTRYTVGWFDGATWRVESKSFSEAGVLGWTPIERKEQA